jgi:cytosine/adenosine deaminase-related metal-dependent hydrolase
MRSASRTLTEDADDLLRMITSIPGDILAPRTALGTLRANAPADLIALPLSAESARAIVDYEQRVPWVMIASKMVVNRL